LLKRFARLKVGKFDDLGLWCLYLTFNQEKSPEYQSEHLAPGVNPVWQAGVLVGQHDSEGAIGFGSGLGTIKG